MVAEVDSHSETLSRARKLEQLGLMRSVTGSADADVQRRYFTLSGVGISQLY